MNFDEIYIEEQNLREMLANPLTADGFRITDYLRKGLTTEQLVSLLRTYEGWRGDTAAEDIYDLKDSNDASILIKKYGVDKVISYINAGYRYAFDGYNFADMVVIRNEDMTDTIDRLCDIDFVAGLVGNGAGDLLEPFFEMKPLLKEMKGMGFHFCGPVELNEPEYPHYRVNAEYDDGTKGVIHCEVIHCCLLEDAIYEAERIFREWKVKGNIRKLEISFVKQ